MHEKKLTKILLILIVALVIIAILLATGVFKPQPSKKTTDHADTGGANITSALDAHDAAGVFAKGWRPDAVLSSITSNRAGVGEPVNDWRFIFISASAPGKGFLVEVSTLKVIDAHEINYAGTGAPVPDNIISQGEAIRRVHAIHGYENQPVIGVEAVFDPIKKAWFWAARTPRGVVSIEADR